MDFFRKRDDISLEEEGRQGEKARRIRDPDWRSFRNARLFRVAFRFEANHVSTIRVAARLLGEVAKHVGATITAQLLGNYAAF